MGWAGNKTKAGKGTNALSAIAWSQHEQGSEDHPVEGEYHYDKTLNNNPCARCEVGARAQDEPGVRAAMAG